MAILVVVLGITLLLLALVVVLWLHVKEQVPALPYQKAGALLTRAELRFYQALKQAVPVGYFLAPKVRIGDVLTVQRGLDRKQALISRSKIQQKHFDFVICQESGMQPVCCVELQDSSHRRADRISRDKFVRAACEAAGIPLLEIINRQRYIKAELQDQINTVLTTQEAL